MKVYKILVCLSMIMLLVNFSYGQQDAQFSQYMFNSMYYNPGFAGIDGLTRATLIYRNQYTGYKTSYNESGSPQSIAITASTLTPFLNKSIGAGFNFLYDQLGPLTNYHVELGGSYLFRFKGGGTLGLGLRGGILGIRSKGDYRVIDEDDNIYQSLKNGNGLSQIKPDFTAGLVYRTSKFYVGGSFSHLLRNKYDFNVDLIKVSSVLENHLYVTGGYNFDVGTMIEVTPSVLVQTDLKQVTYLFGAIGTYNEKFWAGLQARQSFANREVSKSGKTLSNDDLILLLGVNLIKNKQNNNALKIGYAFDFVTSGRKAKAATSHELLLSYLLVPPWDIVKPKIRTPRYRHDEN